MVLGFQVEAGHFGGPRWATLVQGGKMVSAVGINEISRRSLHPTPDHLPWMNLSPLPSPCLSSPSPFASSLLRRSEPQSLSLRG